jgi:hypothetical protein
MSRRPDLIVPIRDRRQHKRYLTLKNTAIAFAVAFVAFVGVSIYSEVRRPAANEYGRLVRREAPESLPEKPLNAVTEAAPIDDQLSADPMRVDAFSRSRWLGDDAAAVAPVARTEAAIAPPAGGQDVVIVGGPEGVSIARQDRRRPVLSGGFGR